MTSGSALNCVSRSSQSRIEELPTNKTPPGGTFWRRSAAANAAMLSFHREDDGGGNAARMAGSLARADEPPTRSQGGTGELQIRDSVFVDVEFFLLMLFSIAIPVGTYRFMMWRRAISRKTVLLLGFMLVAKSGVTMFLLQRLAEMAKG